jgi:ABC-type transport system substrate-binding protein
VAALGTPVSLRLIIGPSAGQRTVAETLRAQWQQVGIEVEVVVQTGDEQLLNIIDGTYQLALWDYATPTDPDESYVWFHTDATPGEFTYNLPRLSDSSVDRGFDTGRQKPALEDRQKGYAEVQKGLVERVPAIYLAYLPRALAVSSRIVGWQTDTVGGFGRGGAPWATELGFA